MSNKQKRLHAYKKAAIASTLEQAKHEYDLDNISTKRDLNELELRLTIKMGTMLSVAVAAIAALVKLL